MLIFPVNSISSDIYVNHIHTATIPPPKVLETPVMTTGRERTQAEWAAVIHGAGLRLTRLLPAGPASSILEVDLGG
jgi:hypothetical protein